MNKFYLIVLFFSFALTPLNAARAQDAALLNASVQGLDKVVQDGLTKVENILSEQQRMLFMNLVNYTGFLKSELKYLADDLSRDLNQKELAILSAVQEITVMMNDANLSWLTKSEDVSTLISSSLSRTLGADRHPAPTFYKIPLITNVQNKNLDIEIKGIRLNNKKNHIIFAGRTIPVATRDTDEKNTYVVSLTDRDVFNPDTLNTFKVVLFKKRFLAKEKRYEYISRFMVVPSYIGTVTVFYKLPSATIERANGNTDIVHATSKSNKTKDVEKQFNLVHPASANWRLDQASISCSKISGKGDKHGYGGPYKITEISFVAKAYAKDGKATCRCTWNEYRMVSSEETRSAAVDLGINQQHIIELPKQAVLFKTVVSYKDGTTFQSSNLAFKEKFVDFVFKPLQNLWEVKFAN